MGSPILCFNADIYFYGFISTYVNSKINEIPFKKDKTPSEKVHLSFCKHILGISACQD